MTVDFSEIPMRRNVYSILINGGRIVYSISANKSFRYKHLGDNVERVEYAILIELTEEQRIATITDEYPNGFNYCWASTGMFDDKIEFSLSGYINQPKRYVREIFRKKVWE